jgi:uncharacterized protein YbjT (DUF2867 family)
LELVAVAVVVAVVVVVAVDAGGEPGPTVAAAAAAAGTAAGAGCCAAVKHSTQSSSVRPDAVTTFFLALATWHLSQIFGAFFSSAAGGAAELIALGFEIRTLQSSPSILPLPHP